MTQLCIYHKDCTDGFMSFTVVKKKYPDIAGYPAKYGESPPDVTDKDVIIVDFSYPRDTVLEMHSKARSLLVLDHHKTAKESLSGLDFAIFDMSRCGASLAFSYLFPDQELPKIIKYVEDRDLWRRELPHSDLVANALWLMPKEFERWEELLHYNEAQILKLAEQGRTIEAVKNAAVDKLIANKLPIRLGDLELHAVNSAIWQSEIGHRLLETEPIGVVFSVMGEDVLLSLRSRADRPDVSEIAKAFGGGGHRNAAGFKVSAARFFQEILKPGLDSPKS